jgi:membrane protein
VTGEAATGAARQGAPMNADPAPPTDAPGPAPRGKVDAVVARYTRTRERLDASAAGHVQRRISELDLANQALIPAALAFMLLIPV